MQFKDIPQIKDIMADVLETLKTEQTNYKNDGDLRRGLRALLVKKFVESDLSREQLAYLATPAFISSFELALTTFGMVKGMIKVEDGNEETETPKPRFNVN